MTTLAPRKRPGRPPRSGMVFDSMTAASEGLGVPLSMLKAIKNTGSQAFRWGKVYETELRAWLNAHVGRSEADDYAPTHREKLADDASFAMWRKFEGAEMVERAKRGEKIFPASADKEA